MTASATMEEIGTWTPPLATPGPETAALTRFHFDRTWTGAVETGMMGPGSPSMSADGSARFEWTDDTLWLRGEFAQDQVAGGRVVLPWRAHDTIGWAPAAPIWVDEVSVDDGPWQLIERYVLTPVP